MSREAVEVVDGQVIGNNIARLRHAQGITQEDLATRSGVSVVTISRLERGHRNMVRSSTVVRLAAALDVKPAMLYHHERTSPAVGADVHRHAAALRRMIRGNTSDALDFVEDVDVSPSASLRADTSHAWQDYLSGHHAALLDALPALFADARRAVHAASGDAAADAQEILCVAYRLATGLAGRLGLTDLALFAGHRALDTARLTREPAIESAVATRYLVWVLVRQGEYSEAEQIAVSTAERLDPGLATPDPETLGVFGNLLFNAATAALRRGNGQRADDLLTVARAAALRSGQDRVTETGIFGPRSAAIQHLDHTIRAGDPERALRLAIDMPPSAGAVPAFWEAGHQLHLASAAADVGLADTALDKLLTARDLAPDWVAVQPLSASIVRDLLPHCPKRRRPELTAIAAHDGCTD
ncbi:helix-turn-helix domain-containing protein [Allosaccharopolyspora coralli]|uniref:Helix-turn-helix domain-containing protein n=1 Tax=Allosaccharopolyspora coralli TaxID=2665642 RepID=A0A5Q3QAQ8_9PSEU|nr:helix-turn-helix domain-containing protein [Allosaccharopolyspora coralli]QGK70284.1 helix-turn-helix domain-containing protein [Allosaccharopolyspora coralli]